MSNNILYDVVESRYQKSTLITAMMMMALNQTMKMYSGNSIKQVPTKPSVEKQWIHDLYGPTVKPRKEHIAINGESVKLTEKFSIGFNPRESKEPRDTINCNCGVETDYTTSKPNGYLKPNSRFEHGKSSLVLR